MMEVTRRALEWLAEDPNRTAYQAAQKFGVEQSTLSRARRREASKKVCPTCGHVSYNVDEVVVAAPKRRRRAKAAEDLI